MGPGGGLEAARLISANTLPRWEPLPGEPPEDVGECPLPGRGGPVWCPGRLGAALHVPGPVDMRLSLVAPHILYEETLSLICGQGQHASLARAPANPGHTLQVVAG